MLQACPTEVRVHEHRAIKVCIVKDCTLQIGTLEVGSVQAGIGKVGFREVRSLKVACRKVGRPEERRCMEAERRFIGPPLIGPSWRSLKLKRRRRGWECAKGYLGARRSKLGDRDAKSQYAWNQSPAPHVIPRKEISIASLLAETGRPKPDTFYPRIPTLPLRTRNPR
jgi:hypothetical protein